VQALETTAGCIVPVLMTFGGPQMTLTDLTPEVCALSYTCNIFASRFAIGR
jgi:hypothetical protein